MTCCATLLKIMLHKSSIIFLSAIAISAAIFIWQLVLP